MQIIRSPHTGYVLTTEFWTPRPLRDVFPFFADANNLQVLTPAFLNFQVLTPSPITMNIGTIIDYQIRLHGWPIRWKTLISAWDPPWRFVDELVHGPYRFWHHEHTFEERQGGTLIRDVVHYGVPGGALAHELFVRPDLQRIFRYRTEQMANQFSGTEVIPPEDVAISASQS